LTAKRVPTLILAEYLIVVTVISDSVSIHPAPA